MIWGCVNGTYVDDLVKIDGNLLKEGYKEILERNVISSATSLIGEDFVSQHDKEPKHIETIGTQMQNCYKVAAPKFISQSDPALVGEYQSISSKIFSKFDNSTLGAITGYVEESRAANTGKAARENAKTVRRL
ncbi:hypothetical protein Trydic_g23529 [Trypoxylus dichotomus]